MRAPECPQEVVEGDVRFSSCTDATRRRAPSARSKLSVRIPGALIFRWYAAVAIAAPDWLRTGAARKNVDEIIKAQRSQVLILKLLEIALKNMDNPEELRPC